MSDEVLSSLIAAVASVTIALAPPLFLARFARRQDAELRSDEVVASLPCLLPPPPSVGSPLPQRGGGDRGGHAVR